MGSEDGKIQSLQVAPDKLPAARMMEDAEYTPRSELPPMLKVSTPHASEIAARQESGSDYFTHLNLASAPEDPLQHSASQNPASPAGIANHDVHSKLPSAASDVASSILLAERPTAQTNESSLSLQSTDSTATVTAPSDSSAFPPHQSRYPDQSFAALHSQQYPTRSFPTLRRSGSQPTHIVHNFLSASGVRHATGARTNTNSPALGPGLFSLTGPPSLPSVEALETPGAYGSPFLHHTHMHVPKETHKADVDHNALTGRKQINQYEIIDELGRGTHGKVKLGRNLLSETDGYSFVAIKIVERLSRKRRLGRLGTNTDDRIKKEVAILKKARHQNIVALLEVIDDPNKKKVYIVLEWVENGEIHWRADAKNSGEITMLEARRYEREKSGVQSVELQQEDEAILKEAEKRLARKKRRQQRERHLARRGTTEAPQAWSIELAGDYESGESEDDMRSLSRVSTTTTDSLPGSRAAAQGRQSSRSSSYADVRAEGASSQHITAEPEQMSHNESIQSPYSDNGLESSMFGAYDSSYRIQSRGASVTNSIHSSKKGSTPDLPRFAREFLDSELDTELEYVPVMTMYQIRVAFQDTLVGLMYLHYQGIVHRDIKPPNLLATGQGRVKISDFGVSYLGRPVHDGDSEDLSEAETQDLHSEAKELAKNVGTPAFYAPELCNTDQPEDNLPVTKAIDVWALGVTLFCMLFARTPFYGDQMFVVMRQIADDEVYIPHRRLKPVNPKPNSRSDSNTRAASMNSLTYRDEFDIEYEPIEDILHDLLTRLLTKNPRERITLEEVRHHPWVVAELPDKIKWLEDTDPSQQSQGKKIEISKEELNTAVVPLSMVDRVRSGLNKVGSEITKRLGISKSKASERARGNSTASDTPAPSASSSSSTIDQDIRRLSVRGDESILSALKASRESEHPLSNSVAASPDQSRDHYFDTSHANHYSHEDSGDEQSGLPRPKPPTRANTLMSTAASLRTVRQSDVDSAQSAESEPQSPAGNPPSTPLAFASASGTAYTGSESTGRGAMGSARGRAAKANAERLRSRDRSEKAVDRHAEPIVALSQALAAGHMDPPEALKDLDSSDVAVHSIVSTHTSGQSSAASSRPHSAVTSPEHLSPEYAHHGFLTRNSSSSSVDGQSSHLVDPASSDLSNERRGSNAYESSSDDLLHSQGNQLSRVSSRQKPSLQPALPSPMLRDRTQIDSRPVSPSHVDLANAATATSLSTSPTQATPSDPNGGAYMAAMQPISSSSDFSHCSTSMSNPSIPSVSQVSSLDSDDRYRDSSEEKRDTSSDDTMDAEHNDANAAPSSARNSAFGDDDDADDEDYDSSSDSDGGLVMSRRKSNARPPGGMTAALETRDSGKSDSSPTPKKSSRRGSNNTMKKVRTRDSIDESRHDASGRGSSGICEE